VKHDPNHYQIHNMNGHLVSVSSIENVEELQQLLCNEMQRVEEFFDVANQAQDHVAQAYERWARSPGRGSK